jgi:hypothetical protein
VPTDNVNGTWLHRPKDLSRVRNRSVFLVESAFPSLFYRAKGAAVRTIIKLKARPPSFKEDSETAVSPSSR